MELDKIADGDVYARELTNMVKKTSVPQIYINGEHIGGYDQLLAANQNGTLDQKIAQPYTGTTADTPTAAGNRIGASNGGELNSSSTPRDLASYF